MYATPPAIVSHHEWHIRHEAHLAHERHLAYLLREQLEAQLEAEQQQQASAPHPAMGNAVANPAYPGAYQAPDDGSYQACVIQHESGGNYGAVNPQSGAGGAYQFLPSTWASLGYSGLPQNAPPAEQDQAFAREYALNGTSPWITDGCT